MNYKEIIQALSNRKEDVATIGRAITAGVVLNAENSRSLYYNNPKQYFYREEGRVHSSLENLVGGKDPQSIDRLVEIFSMVTGRSRKQVVRINFLYDALVFLYHKEDDLSQDAVERTCRFLGQSFDILRKSNPRLKSYGAIKDINVRRIEYGRLVRKVQSELGERYNFVFQ